MVSKERLHQLIDALPDLTDEESETVARLLEALLREHRPVRVTGDAFFDGLHSTALQPEIAPIDDIDELRGDFWPVDEGPDDFVNAVRSWRREGGDA
jgi:hypothetical protein